MEESENTCVEIVLIAGGADKNLDYEPIGRPILEKVKTLILIGQTAEKIFDTVKQEEDSQNKNINIYMCNSLNQAVILAKRYAKPRSSSIVFTCKYKF